LTGVRVLGLDLGAKRIGVAVSDSGRRVATPIQVLARAGDRGRDHRAIADLVAEWEAGLVVVGLPVTLKGDVGIAAEGVLDEVAALREVLPVPVDTYDERLTTVTADRSLMDQHLRAPARRKVVDKVAAAVLLQAWLDRNAAGGR
jgi:putative holliday junction resolvase